VLGPTPAVTRLTRLIATAQVVDIWAPLESVTKHSAVPLTAPPGARLLEVNEVAEAVRELMTMPAPPESHDHA